MDLPHFAAHQRRQPPELLFHYTSPTGLEGILRSKQLWATSLQYLNDTEELKYAQLLVQSHLRDRSVDAADSTVRDILAYAAEQLERTEGLNASAFSLSEHRDLLSQWRGYCPPTGGFAVGFPGIALRAMASEHGLLLGPCLYRPEEQLPLVKELVDYFESRVVAILKTVTERGSELAEHTLPGLFKHFSNLAPFIKSGYFAEEAEWRLVFVRTPLDEVNVDVRVGRTMLIPHAIIDIGPLGSQRMREVVVGPCAHPDLSMKAVRLLAKVTGNEGLQVVRRSAVSFRAL